MAGDIAQLVGISSATCPTVLRTTVSPVSILQPIPMARSFHRIRRPFPRPPASSVSHLGKP
jgi:hypothetical protein